MDTKQKLSLIDSLMAPYAQKNLETKGRAYPLEEPEGHPFEKDLDLIVGSRAFRRLEYKTQVFINGEGDHYRTRMTHSLEIARIARLLAAKLGLNEVLVEAIAFAHDIGHAPFGHAGEETLNKIMKEEGGFEHNRHSLRIAEQLEFGSTKYPGLNLSWETREGLIKHSTACTNSRIPECFLPGKSATLETQTVDISDEIAYVAHDLDDGIYSGLITLEQIRHLAVVDKVYRNIPHELLFFPGRTVRYLVRQILEFFINDVYRASAGSLAEKRVKTLEDVRSIGVNLISYSEEGQEVFQELRQFLMKHLYLHSFIMETKVAVIDSILKAMFSYLENNPQVLKTYVRERPVKDASFRRMICDYIAGMTDRFTIEYYEEHIPDPDKASRLQLLRQKVNGH
jgi:dGTPase